MGLRGIAVIELEQAAEPRSYLHGHSALSRASSRHSQAARGGYGRATPIRDSFLHVYSCYVMSPVLPPSPPGARAREVPVVQRRSARPWSLGVTRPRRLTGRSRTTPIGWLQRVSYARRPRVPTALPAPRPRCRSPSRQASVRET